MQNTEPKKNKLRNRIFAASAVVGAAAAASSLVVSCAPEDAPSAAPVAAAALKKPRLAYPRPGYDSPASTLGANPNTTQYTTTEPPRTTADYSYTTAPATTRNAPPTTRYMPQDHGTKPTKPYTVEYPPMPTIGTTIPYTTSPPQTTLPPKEYYPSKEPVHYVPALPRAAETTDPVAEIPGEVADAAHEIGSGLQGRGQSTFDPRDL